MTKFKGVNLRKTLIEKIDEAVETIKNPSGTKKYRSRAAFVTKDLIARFSIFTLIPILTLLDLYMIN